MVVFGLLVGCVQDPVQDPPPVTTTPPTQTAPPVVEQPDPEYLPYGSAAENLEYFDFVNAAFFKEKPKSSTTDIIKHLVSSGFNKTAMQITKDTTPIGRAPEAIEFSVKILDDCLVGQLRAGEYSSMVAPALSDGSCLIGETKPL